MEAKVIKPFYDLEHPENIYKAGDTFSGSAERIAGLVEKGFVEKAEKAEKAQKTEKAQKAEKAETPKVAPRKRNAAKAKE